MNLTQIVDALVEERDKLDRAIRELSPAVAPVAQNGNGHQPSARRKLSDEEKAVISARMRAYWKKQRKTRRPDLAA